jgi:hypothetical protein
MNEKVYLHNWRDTNMPNILHFQGKAKNHYSYLFSLMCKNKLTNPDDIQIVTCVSDESLSPLIAQLKQNNIQYTNCFKGSFYTMWENTMKIRFLAEFFKTADPNKIYLIVDGYDVAIQSLEGLYKKFLDANMEIIFNATKHNWPDVSIDKLEQRDFIGEFKCFNAGACIGYGYKLKDFYDECLNELNNTAFNPWKSEQYIVRKVWAGYSVFEHRDVDFDWQCNIFQTFGSTKLEKIDENNYKVI